MLGQCSCSKCEDTEFSKAKLQNWLVWLSFCSGFWIPSRCSLFSTHCFPYLAEQCTSWVPNNWPLGATQLDFTLGCEELIVHPFLKVEADRKLWDLQKGNGSWCLQEDGERKGFGGWIGARKREAGPMEMNFAEVVYFPGWDDLLKWVGNLVWIYVWIGSSISIF